MSSPEKNEEGSHDCFHYTTVHSITLHDNYNYYYNYNYNYNYMVHDPQTAVVKTAIECLQNMLGVVAACGFSHLKSEN